MKLKNILSVLIVNLLIWSTIGCTGNDTSQPIIYSFDVNDINNENSNDIFTTSISYYESDGYQMKRYIGVISEIHSSSKYLKDTILFNDGTLVFCTDIERYDWVINERYSVDIVNKNKFLGIKDKGAIVKVTRL